MSTLPSASPPRALIPALLTVLLVLVAALLAAATACTERSEPTKVMLPLLVISGPDNLTSFEVRTSTGDTIWRLEAEIPTEVPFLVYATVPDGFRQVFPRNGTPRPLRIGEDLVMVSRIPTRVFTHRAFASSESTVTILESEMRRIELDGGGPGVVAPDP